jgi:hypothetical protein
MSWLVYRTVRGRDWVLRIGFCTVQSNVWSQHVAEQYPEALARVDIVKICQTLACFFRLHAGRVKQRGGKNLSRSRRTVRTFHHILQQYR